MLDIAKSTDKISSLVLLVLLPFYIV